LWRQQTLMVLRWTRGSLCWELNTLRPTTNKFLFGQVTVHEALNAIWSSKALPKLKVFLWLLMHDRLNTHDIMLRKNWKVDSGLECVLCNATNVETRNHLFF
jgi:hypothetical protein